MHFRSIADLSRDISANLHKIPRDVDVVVGIARSGIIPATMIALALNLPMAELRTFAQGHLFGVGNTRQGPKTSIGFDKIRHALVVDDSILQGRAMREARSLLASLGDKFRITYAAIYGTPSATAADLVFETLPMPRIFEWNMMHHSVLANACVDIDGVLCGDPTTEENDDGEAYLNFLRLARPRFIPTRKIGELVTSRLEKYRVQTEQWLAEQGVEYDRLIMLDLPSAEERRRRRAHGEFKGRHYQFSKAVLFIESNLRQALEIAQISGKPVLSLEGPVMCMPGTLSLLTRRAPSAILRKISSVRRRVGHLRSIFRFY